jgi:hypothetical protein
VEAGRVHGRGAFLPRRDAARRALAALVAVHLRTRMQSRVFSGFRFEGIRWHAGSCTWSPQRAA